MVQTSAHFNNLDILSKFIGKDYKTNTAQFDKMTLTLSSSIWLVLTLLREVMLIIFPLFRFVKFAKLEFNSSTNKS